MISEVFKGLWVGPGQEVRDVLSEYVSGQNQTDPKEFSAAVMDNVCVLNVADDFAEFPHHRDIFYAHAGLNDGPEDWKAPWGQHNSMTAYCNAIMMLDHLMFHFNEVFVHCHGGVSRSCFVIAMYICNCFGVPYDLGKRMLKEAHSHTHIHPKHEHCAADILGLLGNVPFISSMRLKDSALKAIFDGFGVDDWIMDLFKHTKPDLRVVEGGVKDVEGDQRE